MKIYDCKMYYSDVLVRNFIPCYRNSDNEIGLYDLVNDVFYTNQRTGVFTYGSVAPTPDAPIEMVSCGDRTKNLLNYDLETELYYYDAKGNKTSTTYSIINQQINVLPNTDYKFTFDYNSLPNNSYLRFVEFDINGNFLIRNLINTTNNVITTQPNTSYVILSIDKSDDRYFENPMVQQGPLYTPYEPYGYKIPVNVNNVITNIYLDEPLRKIDGYSDYIDFKNGKVVRNISEYKITGNENWQKQYGDNLFDVQECFNDKPFIPSYGLCNMYKYNSVQSGIDTNTVNGEFALQKTLSVLTSTMKYNLFIKNTSYSDKDLFKTYLQNLYNNNTPVIINYPLETPTEESITLPNILTVDGNNTLNIETEITPSQIYIKYKSNN